MDKKLVGERIFLGPFREEDVTNEYVAWLNDPVVVRYSNQRFRHHDRASCLAYLNSFGETDNSFLAIRTMDGSKMIGTITAHVSPHHRTADMGLLIGERVLWGRGFGLEAWNLLLNYQLIECKLRKVTAGTLRCNVGMVSIMERSGMQLEGVRAQQELVDGEPQDILFFAKFRAD